MNHLADRPYTHRRLLELSTDAQISDAEYRAADKADRESPITFPASSTITYHRSAAIDAAADLAQCLKNIRDYGPSVVFTDCERIYRARLAYSLAQWKAAKGTGQKMLMAAE